ncbi:MAG TPA: Crp/Fnr family transcriptional regulator [Clostridium sp.]|jgi:CRP-like cAMP-binding protein|uniref:Crp/Fnr family transcriptional regulator n=1 Tax=Clostridium lapidicellarium TaxID=3240931 RepID=A0ABV4E0G9_9CLOT|nr:Crp/Fnr family transcriptional regulator [uncultured Clostridium sp.]NLU07583.1 Crp/Fnr family transcriptional regulator [Clostridiales bacterium]HBC95992.1 Crp/Fnr family transcriptional regulator [Clostridium sp.]
MIEIGNFDFNKLSMFKDMDESTLKLLKQKSFKEYVPKGKILFYERDRVDRIYFILNGKMTMYRMSEEGQKRIIYILNDGEFINEVTFENLPVSISCQAFEDSCILYFLKKDLMEIMSGDFDLTCVIMNSMAKKIRRLYRQLKNTVPLRMDKKLAAKLWKLSRDYGVKTEEGTLIDLNMSITYLADMLGSTRETVSRCMNGFKKKGMIIFQNRKIIVVDPKVLSLYFRGI